MKTAADGKRKTNEAHLVGIACGLVALVTSALVAGSILAANKGNVSTLVRMAGNDALLEVAQRVEPNFVAAPQQVHYDGVYYYAIAIDPFATGEAHELIDLPAHRYGHPAYGWAAGIASLGQARWVPEALLALSIAGMVIGSYFTARLVDHFGVGSPWAGLLVALNPGLLFAVAADLSEALSAAVLALALWFWLRGRRPIAVPFLILLCFLKFQLVLVPVGLGLWELVRAIRGRPIRIPWGSLGLLATGPFFYVLWTVFVYRQLGEWPFALGPDLLSVPPLGFLSTIGLLGHTNQVFSGDAQLVAAQLPILVGTFVLFVLGVVRSLRLRNAVDCIFLFQGLMFLALNDWNLYYPKELIRVMAIPAILLVMVMTSDRNARRLADAPEILPSSA